MFLSQLHLTNYKNYTSAALTFHKDINVLTGLNGAGKTNLLDAIYQLSFCKSNFQHRDKLLVKDGEDFFRLQSQYKSSKGSEKVVIKFSDKSKKVTEYEGKKVVKMSDHVGRIPLVFAGPRDIQLFFDGSAERRRFVDSGISQLDKLYLSNLLLYNRVLLQRNAYLKSTPPHQVDDILLQSFNQQLLEPAQYVFKKRTEFVERFAAIFKGVYQEISSASEVADVRYKSQLADQAYTELLLESKAKDLILQRTTKGVHKDDLIFYLNGKELKQFGSEGQLKSYLLALKLSMWQVIKSETSQPPILLLDDIFAKLDAQRVENLLAYIQQACQAQIFISDTDQKRVSDILVNLSVNHDVFSILNNEIKLIDET